MRYRALSSDGDYTFGQGQANFLINTPACVGQHVLTRLRLWQGEWFLDSSTGTPYNTQILGKVPQIIYDGAIQQVIINTEGVTSIAAYSSSVDPTTRALTVNATINTIFGQTNITATL